MTNVDVASVQFIEQIKNLKKKKAGHIQQKYNCYELSRLDHIGVYSGVL